MDDCEELEWGIKLLSSNNFFSTDQILISLQTIRNAIWGGKMKPTALPVNFNFCIQKKGTEENVEHIKIRIINAEIIPSLKRLLKIYLNIHDEICYEVAWILANLATVRGGTMILYNQVKFCQKKIIYHNNLF